MIAYIISGSLGLSMLAYWYRQSIRNYLVAKAISLINNQPMVKSKNTQFVLSENRKSATISFMHEGKLETVYVPFERRLVPSMLNSRVVAHFPDERTLELTQKPGIPLLITAAHLGASQIITENLETGEKIIHQ